MYLENVEYNFEPKAARLQGYMAMMIKHSSNYATVVVTTTVLVAVL